MQSNTKFSGIFLIVFYRFQDESSYVLKETLTTSSLIDFVYNYTMNKLPRHLRHDGNAKHSHFYSPINSQSDENYHPNIDQKNPSRILEPITIASISSENFTNFISDPYRVSNFHEVICVSIHPLCIF